jgi:hypothetical protein
MMALYKFTPTQSKEGRVLFRDEMVRMLMDTRPTGALFEEVDVLGDEPSWTKVGDVRKGKITFTRIHSLFD